MIKYIISWCVINVIADPCPGLGVDQFGRKSIYSCAVYHCHQEYKCGNTKSFNNRTDAMQFYKDANEEQGLDSVKIDSIKTF